MLDHELVKKTEEFLKQKFDAAIYLNEHPKDKAYRIEHSYRVANIGREIAQNEGFDETEMVIACLLHDIAYCEEFGENGWQDHGRHSARIARPFLKELGIPEDRIHVSVTASRSTLTKKRTSPAKRRHSPFRSAMRTTSTGLMPGASTKRWRTMLSWRCVMKKKRNISGKD